MLKSIFFICFFYFGVFSQSPHKNTLEGQIKEKCKEYNSEFNFNKSQFFFLKKEWDSTLFYSLKQLNSNSVNKELIDYSHYFRGFSFKQKKLFREAKKEFCLISKNFPFNYKVKLFSGEIFLEQGNYQKAIYYFKDIEKLPLGQYDFNISAVYHNLGLCYFHINNYDKAEKYLFKSVHLQEQQKDKLRLISSYMDIANLYYEQYKDAKAAPYFEKAYQLSKKTKDNELKQNSAFNMSIIEENRHNFLQSLIYRKEYEKWKDSLNNQNEIWALAELEKKFAVTQKEKKIKLLQTENKLKIAERNGLLLSFVFLIILFGAGIYFYVQKIKNNRIIISQKKDLDELNSTKDKLFSIVSHDLRSSVNALKSSNKKIFDYLEIKNFIKIDSLLQNNSSITNSVYNLLDNLLNWSLLQTRQLYFCQESLHLSSVVAQIEQTYKPLMSYKNIHFQCDISKNIYVEADLDSLKIILRNLLDNAIKFSKENSSISIFSEISSSFYNIVIQDSGVGMNEDTQRALLKESFLLNKKSDEIVGTGLGIQLCKAMIKKNNGVLSIESKLGIGTKMIVQLQKTKG